ncbi:uncharacterized protein N0V89_009461 [Didymosphaeria variabile]|uniref:Ankyrin n=1 Tax=Didymosphaeria variabile TaxID=1932322 RepID=A0A9W9C866_9PLEO|nr:uncharacterized protein N0V89_009461 [Didymosphaeria variabile]KAJ4348089.1 hypothetical protein N0V89_009461 [Didymosphaeria variabile]
MVQWDQSDSLDSRYSSNIIEHLENKKDGSACLFIFFDHSQKNIQTPYNVTANLLKQLVQQRSGLSEQVRRMYSDFRHLNTPPSTPELLKNINQEIKRFARVRLVVDGLDECPAHVSNNSRAAFLNMIRSLTPDTSLLFTARASNYEEHNLGDVIELRYAPTDQDLHRYLRVQLQNHCAFNEILARADHDQLVEATASHAKGMILLARLHVNSIAAQHTQADLQLALTTLPGDTKHTYEKAMQRISTGDKPLAELVLMWITFAMCPLTMEELRSALAVNENVTSIETAADYMYSEKRLLDVCEGLVVADLRIKPINVRLIHPTARAFFEVYFDNEQAHKSLAMTCLRYLQFEDLRTKICDRTGMLARLRDLPLLRYAALNWGHHAHRTQDKEVVDMSVALLNNKASLVSVAQVMDLSSDDSVSGLYIAAHFGLRSAADQLLLKDPKAVEEEMHGETPLHAASREGHITILGTLLSGRLDPDERSDDGRTPVSLAAENGHFEAVRFFIGSYGVDPNSKSRTPFYKGRTPLSWASGNGHYAVVEYLLAQDNTQVDTSISDGPFMGRTALMMAARDGHEKVVELLLGKGQATAGIVDGDGMTALALAAQQGHGKMVELLLDADHAAAHKRDIVYNRRPVDWASSSNHEAAVRLLLMYPSLDSKDDEERTMMSWESQYGNLDLVQRLLKLGADLNSRDEEEWTPLTYASKFGHTQIVELLLQSNAHVDAQSVDRRSGLSFASEMNHHDTVRSLLTGGAKPDEPDKFGRTPLSYAAGSGSIAIVETLLRYGVDVNLKPTADNVGKCQWAQRSN